MGTGKTKALIEAYNKEERPKVLLKAGIKGTIRSRDSSSPILQAQHCLPSIINLKDWSATEARSTVIKILDGFEELNKTQEHCYYVDEAQFLTYQAFFALIGRAISNPLARLYLAGLDKDSNGRKWRPFEILESAYAFYTKIIRLTIPCQIDNCSSTAAYSQRIEKAEGIILLDKSAYRAVCREHFMPALIGGQFNGSNQAEQADWTEKKEN